MSTLKLYPSSSTGATYSPESRRGAWDAAGAGWGWGAFKTTKEGSVAYVSITANTTANYDWAILGFTYVLPEAASFSGAYSGVIGILEGDDNIAAQLHIHAYVLAGQTESLRGTLISDYIDPDEAEASFNAGEGFSGTVSDVSAKAGDVLVVEFGCRTNSSVSNVVRLYVGGTDATDLADGADVRTYPGWMQFAYTTPSGLLILNHLLLGD